MKWRCLCMLLLMLSGCTAMKQNLDDELRENEPSAIDTEAQMELQLEYAYADLSIEELLKEIMVTYELNAENFSMFYENTVTQEAYAYNPDAFMTGASTVKVAVAMMMHDLAYDENDLLLYTADAYEEGGGYTAAAYVPGDEIPIGYLLEQSIVYSDNTAVNILLNELGVEAFHEYYASLGNAAVPTSFYYENLTSSNLLKAVLEKLYASSTDYGNLLEQMERAMPQRYMKTYLGDTNIAHKYGQYAVYEHDFGIVYAAQPFLMGVLTSNVENAEEVISHITLALYEYQNVHANMK